MKLNRVLLKRTVRKGNCAVILLQGIKFPHEIKSGAMEKGK